MAIGVLNHWGISLPATDCDGPVRTDHIMVTPRDESTKRSTILITANCDESSSPDIWPVAATDIKLACEKCFGIQLDVEIVAKTLTRQKYVGPILDRTDLEKDWNNTILPCIVNSVSCLATKLVQFIGLCRMGFQVDTNNNPITVYIAVDQQCPEAHFAALVQSIRSHDEVPPSFDICIEHNALQTLVFDLLRSDNPEWRSQLDAPYDNRVNAGADLSAARYCPVQGNSERPENPTVGTLGCYIEVRLRGESGWTTFALTNYHVIRPVFEDFQRRGYQDGRIIQLDPVVESLPRHFDLNGVTPYNASIAGSQWSFEHPSRLRHNDTVAILEEELQETQDADGDTFMTGT